MFKTQQKTEAAGTHIQDNGFGFSGGSVELGGTGVHLLDSIRDIGTNWHECDSSIATEMSSYKSDNSTVIEINGQVYAPQTQQAFIIWVHGIALNSGTKKSTQTKNVSNSNKNEQECSIYHSENKEACIAETTDVSEAWVFGSVNQGPLLVDASFLSTLNPIPDMDLIDGISTAGVHRSLSSVSYKEFSTGLDFTQQVCSMSKCEDGLSIE